MAGILLLVLVVCVFGQRPKNDYNGDCIDESNENDVVDIGKIESSINLGNLFED